MVQNSPLHEEGGFSMQILFEKKNWRARGDSNPRNRFWRPGV